MAASSSVGNTRIVHRSRLNAGLASVFTTLYASLCRKRNRFHIPGPDRDWIRVPKTQTQCHGLLIQRGQPTAVPEAGWAIDGSSPNGSEVRAHGQHHPAGPRKPPSHPPNGVHTADASDTGRAHARDPVRHGECPMTIGPLAGRCLRRCRCNISHWNPMMCVIAITKRQDCETASGFILWSEDSAWLSFTWTGWLWTTLQERTMM